MNTQIIGRVRILFPITPDFATSIQIVLSPLLVSVFGIILVTEQTEVNPFFVVGIKYFEFLWRPVREVYFGGFAQVFFGIFLDKCEV